MILTDREIAIALQCGQIRIKPRPLPEDFSSTSVDLKLARIGSVWKPEGGFPIRPGHPDYSYADARRLQRPIRLSRHTLQPRAFVLAWTREVIDLPITSRIAARVEGKSSLARIGVGVHVTAPTIHSGFMGPIQLEIYNFGENEVILDAGMKICQLIFEQTAGTPEKGYSGQFLGQTAARTPRPRGPGRRKPV